jgi:hypothetical protein
VWPLPFERRYWKDVEMHLNLSRTFNCGFRKEGRGSLNTRFSERMKGGSEMIQIAETGRNPMEVNFLRRDGNFVAQNFGE